jgi:predicted dinucleotide-utilizing enzyme
MASKTWNVGIVGYGFSAKIFHIPFVAEVPQFKLYAIVQRTPKPEDDAEKDHPGIKSYRTAEDMIKDAAVDVVIITTAPDSHYALAKLALENGKHGELVLFSRTLIALSLIYGQFQSSCLRKALHSHLAGGQRPRYPCPAAEQAVGRIPKYVGLI